MKSFLVCFFLVLALGLHGENTSFADSLFAHQEYYRAITEYQRCYYAGAEQAYCHGRIIESYLAGEDYEGLISYLEGSPDRVDHLYYTLAHLKNQRPDLAAIVNDDPNDPGKTILFCYSKNYLGEFREAGKRLDTISDSEYREIKEKLQGITTQTEKQHYLSPVLAGTLGIVPGLGYAYGGAWQTALSALATNALLWGVVIELGKNELYFSSAALATAGMGFYLGSIYGSISHAAKRNRETRKRNLDSYSDEIFKELREIAATQ